MISLRCALKEYLAVRRALGFKLERAGHLLPDFITFLERHRTRHITTQLALMWAKQPADGHPAWWAERFCLVRGFAKYLQAIDPRTEVPAADWLPSTIRRVTPYLYSGSDIERLMKAARSLRSPLKARTYATLIGLLAATGLRVGEAIRLDRMDVNWTHRSLIIRNSKFGKSREVPLHDSTVDALRAYVRLRDRLAPRPGAFSFFISTTGTRLIYKNVHFVYHELVHRSGIERRSPQCRPRPHDLRHTFAVNTLIGWYRAGVDIAPRLPLPSTYLGHVDPISTYWYLSAAPELMAMARQRLEGVLETLP